MNFKTRYSCGDKVWHIHPGRKSWWEPCGICGGRGRIVGLDQTFYNCPKCYGRGGETKYGEDAWLVESGPLTVGQVRFEFTGKQDGIDDTFGNFGPQTEETKIEYMCVETGIGPGSVLREERLFPSKEEAEAEAAKRTEAIKDEEP